jgi:hypothetical protein
MRLQAFATLVGLFWCSSLGWATIPLESTPSWSSTDQDYSTGGALGDIDNDGDLDLFVGNGNDMAMEQDRVYYNTGTGLEAIASWLSSDVGYGGHVAIGDVDHDGFIDFAVANYLDPKRDQLYYNRSGILERTPSWSSGDLDNSFAVAFGDVDGDGDLDLAAACGESYSATSQPSKLYRNNGGTLETTASWLSQTGYAYDAAWGDMDGDGDLDLALARECQPNHVYANVSGALQSTPAWVSTESQGTLQCAWGDVDNDGDLDLAVADNAQLCGSSEIRLYKNNGDILETTASWTSATTRTYYSCVAWADVDGDGDLDLASGGWWEPVVVFENLNGILETSPSWSWRPSNPYDLVCEQVVWGDIDRDGMHPVEDEAYSGDGSRKIFYLHHYPAHSFQGVKVDGQPVSPYDYCYDLSAGWLSLRYAPSAGTNNVLISYTYSTDLELVVTNWDEPNGNHLFTNVSDPGPEVTVIPDSYVVPRGGSLGVTITLANDIGATRSVQAWTDAYLPNGRPYAGNPLLGPSTFQWSPGQHLRGHFVHRVPANAPLGRYRYHARIGSYPTANDEDWFTFTVVP